MSHTKPFVNEKQAAEFLSEIFDDSIESLHMLEGGQVLQTYAFDVREKHYILRFNNDNMDANFEKEDFVCRSFSRPEIPIPPIFRFGRYGDLHFCVTKRAEGIRLDQLDPDDVEKAMDSVITTLNAIHSVDITEFHGFGLFDGSGKGFSASWPDYLAAIRDEERADGFYGKWHHLFETSFLARDVFDRVYAHMEQLLDFCPKKRSLVHGGYGFGNLLIADNRVSAVIDWLDAKYGDFLYDLAWLDFWDPERRYTERFQEDYRRRGTAVPDFKERIHCCQCYIALDAMRFFARADNPDAYSYVCNLISAVTV